MSFSLNLQPTTGSTFPEGKEAWCQAARKVSFAHSGPHLASSCTFWGPFSVATTNEQMYQRAVAPMQNIPSRSLLVAASELLR